MSVCRVIGAIKPGVRRERVLAEVSQVFASDAIVARMVRAVIVRGTEQ